MFDAGSRQSETMPHAFNSLPEPDEPFAEAPATDEPVVRPMPAAIRRPVDRRGPLRPGRLISTRSRLKGEVLAKTFTGVDAGVILILSWLACGLANPAGIWGSPVATVVPFALGAVLAVAGSAVGVWQAEGLWFCLAFASLYLLHVWWWISVRRLRQSGRLTPNVVVVGATTNAERLI